MPRPSAFSHRAERVPERSADVGRQLRHDEIVAPVLAELHDDQRLERTRQQRLSPRERQRLPLKLDRPRCALSELLNTYI